MRWSEPALPHDGGPPTIKNHSVTYHDGILYCFGGYDGRKNHMTLMVYSLADRRWCSVANRELGADTSSSSAAAAAAAAAGGGGNSSSSVAGLAQQERLGKRSSAAASAAAAAAVGGGGGGGLDGGEGTLSSSSSSVGPGGTLSSCPYRYVVSGTPPPGRNGHTATLATSFSSASVAAAGGGISNNDDDDARIIIIGGWLGSGPLAASDMHVLDLSGGPEDLRWYQPAVKGTPPGPCNMHSADFVRSRSEIYVFRGGNGREYLNDLHALDVRTYTWRRVQTRGETPQQRANHSSAVMEETGELFIFGGWNGKERLNDIHILDTHTSTWSRPHVGGVLPHPRAGMTLTALRGKLYLFGGSGTSSKCFQDLQILDRKEMAWLDVMHQQDVSHSQTSHCFTHEQQSENDDYYFRKPSDNRSSLISSQSMSDNNINNINTNTNNNRSTPHETMDGGNTNAAAASGGGGFRKLTDWRSQEMDGFFQMTSSSTAGYANPNDEDAVATIYVHGRGPGRRAGHTATAVHRHIYVFGGSCGSDYLNDFFVLDTDPPPSIAVSEPTSLQLLSRRLRHFCNDEEFSDVTFLVEGRRVYGHRLVLSLVSDCFRAMFTTGFRESTAVGCAEIEIPNYSYNAFVTMMEYIYTGQPPKIDIFGPNNSNSNIENVIDLLELSDQFFLEHLKQICEKMLQPAIHVETVDFLMQVSQKTNASQLEAACRHFERNRESIEG